MGCWWNLDGTVKPQDGKMNEAAKILSEYDCYFSSDLEEGTFDLSFGDERWHSFADDLAKELAPLLLMERSTHINIIMTTMIRIVVILSVMADIPVTQAISLSVFPGSKTILRKRYLMKLFGPF